MSGGVFRGTLVSVGLLAVVLSAADPTGAAPESPDPRPLGANLTGDLVIASSGERGTGDPDGTGKAAITRGRTAGEVCVDLVVNRTEEPTAAHIHVSEDGTTGRIVATLPAPGVGPATPGGGSGRPFDGRWSVSCTVLSGGADAAADLFHRAYRYYVDIHSPTHPDGAVRGQLGHMLAVPMTYHEEVDAIGQTARGQGNALGVALLTPGPMPDQLCVSVEFANLNPATALHIHRDTGNQPHPVVVTLPTPQPNTVGGCVEAQPAIVKAVLHEGRTHYVHVHNGGWPNGALRGRIPKNFGT